jgi:flagellin
MALRINTNIASMNAHKQLINTDNQLSSSLERLSSGLRINKAADDASGMAIADSLRSQSLGLGQAIKNGNDGISIVQTADAALQESINIVNTIKQKSIQAAQDGQTTESRKAIQSDISKLREELDTIAKTTAFNNQKLLSGNFTDKKFQIGAYAGETVDISIQSTEATKIGHITTSDMTFSGEGVTELNIYSNLLDKTFSLNSIELSYNNSRENSVGAVADAINKLSDVLGISATASVSSTTEGNITAGTTDAGFAINGVTIGSLAVSENDADGALVSAINNKTSEHGVTASVSQDGILTLSSTDDRAIQVTMGADTKAVMGGTDDLSTLGKVEVRQEGTSQITITDANAVAGIAVSVADGLLETAGQSSGTVAFTLEAGSVLTSGAILASGTALQGTMIVGSDVDVSGGGIIGEGSVLLSGSTIGCGTVLTGTFTVNADSVTSCGIGDATVTAGSTFVSGTAFASGNMTVFNEDVTAQLSGVASGSVVLSGGKTYVTCGATVKAGGLTLTADIVMGEGSNVACGSTLMAGSQIFVDFETYGDTTLTADMAFEDDTTIQSGSTLAAGTVFEQDAYSGNGSITGSTTLMAGSVIESGTLIANGSTFGDEDGVTLKSDEVVAEGQSMLVAGSSASGTILNSGSVITAGTLLTNDIRADDLHVYAAGTVLEYDITTIAQNNIEKDMVLGAGSIISAGSTLGINGVAANNNTESSLTEGVAYRLSDVDVTSQEGAQIGIAVADAALKALDKVRSDLGSVQNQLTSTIANISTTRVNVASAESTIRDVDFAEESANFTKMQILSQAGTFAMSQANASSQNVLSLLQ